MEPAGDVFRPACGKRNPGDCQRYPCRSDPIFDNDGETVISCYGLDDAGLDATDEDIERIKIGQVPQSLLSDSVHYTAATKTVIGTMLYKKMVELGILG